MKLEDRRELINLAGLFFILSWPGDYHPLDDGTTQPVSREHTYGDLRHLPAKDKRLLAILIGAVTRGGLGQPPRRHILLRLAYLCSKFITLSWSAHESTLPLYCQELMCCIEAWQRQMPVNVSMYSHCTRSSLPAIPGLLSIPASWTASLRRRPRVLAR